MKEWTDPRYAELVECLREQQAQMDQRTREGEKPPTVRGFIYNSNDG